MPNALNLLKDDHTRLRGLLDKLEQTSERGVKIRENLLEQIEIEIKVHSKIEEEIFYPAYLAAARKKDDKDLFYEATEEHHVVDMVLPELKATSPKSEQFGAKAKVLKELIEHHADEEEKEMFRRARKLMKPDELREVGYAMAKRKASLLAQFENPLLAPVKKLGSALDKVMPAKLKQVKGKTIAKARKRSSS